MEVGKFIRSFTVPRSGFVTRHQYGISAVISQASFLGETSGGIGSKCQQFSQVIHKLDCFQIRSLGWYILQASFWLICFLFTIRKLKNPPIMPINSARSLELKENGPCDLVATTIERCYQELRNALKEGDKRKQGLIYELLEEFITTSKISKRL